jgi:hypothetical protein
MTERTDFSVDSARAAADERALDRWVAEFLASPGSDNAELAEILSARIGWTGPLELPIDQLNRLAGPPGDPVLVAVDEDDWRDDVEELGEKVEDGWEPPPVVVTYRDDQLVLEDGNHRVEGMRRAGETSAWAVVGFESEADRERFLARHA